MKRQIRQGVFETNSSSVHSMTMCMSSDFENWKSDKLWFCEDKSPQFISKEEAIKINKESGNDWIKYQSYEDWENDIDYRFEQFEDSFETPNGEKVVAFGYHGHD